MRKAVSCIGSLLKITVLCTAQVFKDGRGQATFSAFDLFAMNTNLKRVVGKNFIEDVQTNNLRNYFTLRFQYNLSKIERKKQPLKAKWPPWRFC
jgi:hypothetical protein